MNPPKWRRKMTWAEMAPELRLQALHKLRGLAVAKARHDGTVMPYAWPERIAPLLRYTLTDKGATVWDCNPPPGSSLFTLSPLPL